MSRIGDPLEIELSIFGDANLLGLIDVGEAERIIAVRTLGIRIALAELELRSFFAFSDGVQAWRPFQDRNFDLGNRFGFWARRGFLIRS